MMRILMPASSDTLPTEVADYLLPHEHQAIAVHKHPAVLVIPLILLAASCAAAGTLTAFVIYDNAVVLGLVWAACFVVLLYVLERAAAWLRAYFVITEARMILISGLITRTLVTLPLVKITDVTLLRSKPGRLLGYGKITVATEGSKSIPINYVPYPEQLFQEVREILQLGEYAEYEQEPEADETL